MSENFEKYKGTINSIYNQAKDELWTPPFATLVLLLVGIPIVTIFLNLFAFSFGHWVIALVVYAVEIFALLFVLYRQQSKIYEIVRRKTLEMDAGNPGIYTAFEEWHKKVAPPNS